MALDFANLDSTHHPCRSSGVARTRGRFLANVVSRAESPSAETFARLQGYAFDPQNLFTRVSCDDPWIVTRRGRRRDPLILPNPLYGVKNDHLKGKRLAKALDAGGGAFSPLLNGLDTAEKLLAAWEATAPMATSPLICSISLGRFPAAMPTEIGSVEFPVPDESESVKSRRKRRPNDLFQKALNAARRARANREGAESVEILEQFLSSHFQADRAAAVKNLCLDYLLHKPHSGRFEYTTVERQLRSIPKVVEACENCCSTGAEIAHFKFHSPDIVVADSLSQILPSDHPYRARLSEIVSSDTGYRSYALGDPLLISEKFGMSIHATANPSVQQRALRFLGDILHHGGRRVSCLRDLSLADATTIYDPFDDLFRFSLRIRHGKTLAVPDLPIPLQFLWPIDAVINARELMAMTADVSRDVTFYELAGLQRYDHKQADVASDAIKTAIVRETGLQQRDFHLLRHHFATWWPVRVLCARNPSLLELPALRLLRGHLWFSEAALMGMRSLLGSRSCDAVNVCRMLMGHATPDQFITCYCHSWPLLSVINAQLAFEAGHARYAPNQLQNEQLLKKSSE